MERAGKASLILAASVPTTLDLIFDHPEDPSCIAYSRVGRDVMRQLGSKAEVVACGLRVLNAKAAEHVHEGRPEKIGRGDGSFMVVVGGGDSSRHDRWPGHLIVQVEDAFLLDLSLHQASRPAQGIHVEPSAYHCPEGLLKHGDIAVYALPGGVLVHYERLDDLPAYDDAPAWDLPPWPARQIARGIRAALRTNGTRISLKL